ncbi:sodium:solute symporter family protein [Fuchsiella alkaliacetigena]|uniref:sodium:solute symporter family protein n=1 Tax=Fuchsiella alkaliacetigena TaxID=957042 RepID=UPI00200A0FBC|nr:sodium:solute symporter family protein [Fuchsiella alkaliacetigena]MCK8824153.1 sodium:solute symporter family protein [Fuchsiella alkaliacetigena]
MINEAAMGVNIQILTIIIILYVAVLSYLAYLGHKATKSSEDYLVAGRDINGGIMALSYGVTFISTSAIVGFGGAAAFFGFSLLWLTLLTIVVGVIIAFVLFGVPIRKLAVNLGSTTFGELIGQRYKSRFITFFSGIMIFIFMPAYTSIILVGSARFLESALLINYDIALFLLAIVVGIYVITGGLKTVMYTDAFCALIMLAGMGYLLFSTYSNLGGVVAAHEGLAALKDMVPEGLAAAGHQGWTSMPALGSEIWWTVISTIVMGVGIGVLAQPQLVMRFMTVKKTSSLYRAMVAGSIFVFFMTGTAFIVGPLSNLYFVQELGEIAATVAEGNIDLIIPLFINNMMPGWFVYLIMLSLLSAAISTISSLIHVQATAWGRDIIRNFRLWKAPDSVNDEDLDTIPWITRIGVLIGLIVSIILAYRLPGSIIARATAFWFGICAASFLPTIIGTIYWRGSTKAGAIASIISGYTVALFGFVFMHIDESKPLGISRLIFGRDALFEFPWTHIDPLFYALPVSALVFIIVSWFTSAPAKEHLDRCFDNF